MALSRLKQYFVSGLRPDPHRVKIMIMPNNPVPKANPESLLDPPDHVHFRATEDKFDELLALLDAPPTRNPGLERLFARQPPWEEQGSS